MSISIKLNMHKNWQVIKANGNGIVAVPGGAEGEAHKGKDGLGA